jgi:uncharacterized protein
MEMMPLSRLKLNGILTMILLIVMMPLVACKDTVEKDPENWGWLVHQDKKILVKLAISDEVQQRGFSGTRDEDWPDEDGLLFIFKNDNYRGFWMPDTYFDLDLFYMDENFKIIDIQRKVPHFIGRFPESRVPRARVVWARHVLELKSKSKTAATLKVGDQLRFDSPVPPPQIK